MCSTSSAAVIFLDERPYHSRRPGRSRLPPLSGGPGFPGWRAAAGARAADLPPMGPLQVPIHPYVAEAAGLAFWHPEMRYRWYDNLWTFEEYITRYLAYDRSW
ncbi:hypothetical protein Rru_A0849 [Rhodospirillum rubrum ATCC 11170]|uniref:Uncharacterized protein n=1 Tax=Rhodospirillum rubrum (strain ATCC 11170 / ATH 1.1.1 / DSM 467 / LMG 4362 / NCIMB 8255 / S1) TaxID=269796 RepID=Q2RW45_RHORT|nr:hypothetical protein Rru_A0849 [Rhodospirillum rubrum ATCC 11170]